MREQLKFSGHPELKHPSMVVGWNVDASSLGSRVIEYLNRKLGGQVFCEIEPVDFFPFGGVAIEDNLIQFPESRFYACPKHDMLLFLSDQPSSDYYQFLNLVLDVAGQYYHVKEIHAIGGMVSLGAHTAPRQLLGTFSSPEFKEAFSQYDLTSRLDYETPPGHRPTLNSFLLWAARKRNIPAVSLWVPVPFYLVAVDDTKARKRILAFFNERFELGIDFSNLDEEVKRQEEQLAEIRSASSDIDESIRRLESNLRLPSEESQRLLKEIEKALKEKS